MTSIRSIRKRGQRGWGAPDFTGMLAGLVAFGVLIGVVLTAGLPWLWSWLKPIIHGWTS